MLPKLAMRNFRRGFALVCCINDVGALTNGNGEESYPLAKDRLNPS
jgi:hypothetical protein